ncbi:PREDICTED: cytokine receptor-like factor 2 [Miniopterus natalensis]|uniref:cytokine receptor-like factor 2 n=1 Tax=Miniopterus natalensis TaxID=291302 RepID=UPI0007A6E825|nr:PREDICTED: cytokine receptor-like factor 2 [Miniopterus natalensis]
MRRDTVEMLPLTIVSRGGTLPFQIINFNFETVRVTWNASEHAGDNLTFFYGFRSEEHSQCRNYILQEGRTVGCLLEAEGDKILWFSIRNGTQSLLLKSLWISDYLKPNAPKDLNFSWHQEAMTVTCSNLPYRGLLYEVQHKSAFDTTWQSDVRDTCNITISGLDGDKCYFFRARVMTTESSYGPEAHPSDWSEVTHRQKGELRASCQEKTLFSRFVFIYCMVASLTLFLFVLCLWKIWRVKKLLMPNVPDPKFTFPGLFDSHHGNFQEWIKDTQNVTHLNKTEDREQECVLEEALVIQLPKTEAETPETTMTSSLCLQTAEKEAAAGEPGPLPCQPPQGGEMLCLKGFMFVMSDNSYVTL